MSEVADGQLPPDAAARDAAKRADLPDESTLADHDIRFVTKQVSTEERAAVVAVLTQVRAEEAQRVKRVERIEREPWRRAQRLPRPIQDFLDPA